MALAIGSPGAGRRAERGFTLLEIMIALFIMALVLGIGTKLVSDALADEDLRTAARRLAALAKTARTEALDTGRAYELVLDDRRIQLLPAPDPLRDLEEAAGASVPGQSPEAPEMEYPLPRSVAIRVRPWGEDFWREPKKFVWIFSPSGLCAPNRVRFQRGQAWIEEEFNPLTANRQDEAFYLP